MKNIKNLRDDIERCSRLEIIYPSDYVITFEEYDALKPLLKSKVSIVRAEIKKPPQSESYFEGWLRDFIESIDMKILMGPFVKYSDMPGNEGLTGGAIIETSHVIMHCWDKVEPPIMQLDVYSCSEFDPIKVCDKVIADSLYSSTDSIKFCVLAYVFWPNDSITK